MPDVTSPVPVSSESRRVLGVSDLEKVKKKQIFFVITLDQYLVASNFLISKAAWEGTHPCIFLQM